MKIQVCCYRGYDAITIVWNVASCDLNILEEPVTSMFTVEYFLDPKYVDVRFLRNVPTHLQTVHRLGDDHC
jgi:hypothetical protein